MKFQHNGHIYLYCWFIYGSNPWPQKWPQYGLWTGNIYWRQYTSTEGQTQPLSLSSDSLWPCRHFCLCPSQMRPTHKSSSGWVQVLWEARPQERWRQRRGLRSISATFWMFSRVHYPAGRQMGFLCWLPWSWAPPSSSGHPGRPLCSPSAPGERGGRRGLACRFLLNTPNTVTIARNLVSITLGTPLVPKANLLLFWLLRDWSCQKFDELSLVAGADHHESCLANYLLRKNKLLHTAGMLAIEWPLFI